MLRCAVLKHLRRETWRGLEFTLRDSQSARRFARLDATRLPKKSTLQATVGSVSADTWERINRRLLRAARDAGMESGSRVRVDSTVTETHFLAPTDSRLLCDGVRVLTHLLSEARRHLGAEAVVFHNHCRAAKRCALEARAQRGPARRARTYRKLLRMARLTLGYVDAALPAVAATLAPWAARWTRGVNACGALLRRVMDQATRRVLHGEAVPAADKVVSLFEPHTDIVRKGGRETHYGHKVNLATERSGLVLDAVVETGNPPDSTRYLAVLERHMEHTAPRRPTPRSSWLYDQLKRFRANIEAGISYLKRCFGLARCRWRGLPRFKAYVHSAIFAHNLVRLARLRPQPT